MLFHKFTGSKLYVLQVELCGRHLGSVVSGSRMVNSIQGRSLRCVAASKPVKAMGNERT